MKTDNYTKGVLTVIAVSLLLIVSKEFKLIPSANAAEPQSKFATVPLNQDGSINVRIAADEIVDVQLRGIDEASNLRWEAIKVKTDE